MTSPVTKNSFPALVFLGVAALCTIGDLFPLGALCFGSVGAIYLLNLVAPRLPCSRLIHWIHALLFELFAFVGTYFLRLIPVSQKRAGQGQPILLVHGYLHFGGVWLFQKKWLEAHGFGPIYTISLGHPFRSIASYAEKVKKKAEEIAQETGRKDLLLIGHSMGGLVASYYATQLAPQGSVTDLITIASPLAGTPIARIGLGPNAREMEPKSEFVQQLQKALSNQGTVRFYHIATRSDTLVVPGISAIIEQNPHFIFEDLGHTSLLYSKRVAGQVAVFLKK